MQSIFVLVMPFATFVCPNPNLSDPDTKKQAEFYDACLLLHPAQPATYTAPSAGTFIRFGHISNSVLVRDRRSPVSLSLIAVML